MPCAREMAARNTVSPAAGEQEMIVSSDRFLEAGTAGGRRLRVTFAWHDDRFRHQISIHDENRETPLLSSLEGSPRDNWPPSPPMQQIHVENREDARVILLVGMAGGNHWSMSVEKESGGNGLLFDVACRLHKPAQFIGSTYRAEYSHRQLPREWRLESLPIGRAAAADVQETAPLWTICPPAESLPTVRWKYRVTLTP